MLESLLLLNACQYYDIRLWERFEELGLPPEAFIQEGPALWERIGINERNRATLSKLLASDWTQRELEACDRMGVDIVTCCDAAYPASLRELHDAPLVLYVRGERLAVPPDRSVGVVGTRRCSVYAETTAREIGRHAAEMGWLVISGGARGVDGAAHLGCLDAGGRTVAALGTGVDKVYPAEHRGLFDRIRESGSLVSEYPIGTRGEAWRFPRRNRIIAGLSARTVVVEAPHRSGAMITVRQAAEAGREVWAVPGRIDDERCAGSNRLIFDGAFPLIDMETFFGGQNGQDRQKNLFGDDAIPPEDAVRPVVLLNETEKALVALLTNRSDRTIDNLAEEAKMSAAEVFKTMSLMSLRGLIVSSSPGRYRLVD